MSMIDYLILIPTDEELSSALEVWSDTKPNTHARIDNFDYHRFVRSVGERDALVVFAALSGMGLTSSALSTSHAIRTWTPSNVIQIGIAGSLESTWKLGDLIIPEQIIGLQTGDVVEKTDGIVNFDFRDKGSPVSFSLIAAARFFVGATERHKDGGTY